jgi:hypothetical protein
MRISADELRAKKRKSIGFNENMYSSSVNALIAHPEKIACTNPTYDEAVIAVSKDPYCIRYIENPSEEICKLAVSIKGLVIGCIDKPSPNVCKDALATDPGAIKYMGSYLAEPAYQDVIKTAIHLSPELINYVIPYMKNIERAEELVEYAVFYGDLNTFKNLPLEYRTNESIIKRAVCTDPHILRYVPMSHRTSEVCALAYYVSRGDTSMFPDNYMEYIAEIISDERRWRKLVISEDIDWDPDRFKPEERLSKEDDDEEFETP